MADIFISYASKDRPIAKELAQLLKNRGWTVWWDSHIPIGDRFDTAIEKELRNAKAVLVLWTKHSIASEWVKNEASDAAQRGILIPVLLESVTIPLAFSRIETALLTDWKGEEDHHELQMMFKSVEDMVSREPSGATTDETAGNNNNFDDILTSLRVKNIRKQNRMRAIRYGLLAIVGIAGIVFLLSYFSRGREEGRVTIRIFDGKKNPVTQGDVKIYLDEYVRTQSIDKSGQVLFTGIPPAMTEKKLKIEVSSTGYITRTFDTLLHKDDPIELVLPYSTVVYIRGKVKTAAEVPINGVEINVDGTRYYALSITDGSYNIRLEEYTMGDEITLTTSHPDFEDKTTDVKINSTEILNKDIFLNPVTR